MSERNKIETRLTDTENKPVVTSGGRGGESSKIREGDYEVQITRYKINKIQGYNV